MAHSKSHKGLNTDPRSIARKENAIRAMGLRRSGCTYTQIADALKIARGLAYKYVASEVQLIYDECNETANELRAIEVARLDEMTFAVAADTKRGDLEAIKTSLKIMERRARLLGLDAPFETVNTTTENLIVDSPTKQARDFLRQLIGGGGSGAAD